MILSCAIESYQKLGLELFSKVHYTVLSPYWFLDKHTILSTDTLPTQYAMHSCVCGPCQDVVSLFPVAVVLQCGFLLLRML